VTRRFSVSDSSEVALFILRHGSLRGRYVEELCGTYSTEPFACWLIYRTLSWRELRNDYCIGTSANIYT
jgi:hypothetical protein